MEVPNFSPLSRPCEPGAPGSSPRSRPPSSEEPVAALRAVLWVGTEPYFPFALLSFAPYGGIGIKTTLGMGGVSVEPLVLPQRSL